MTQPVRIPSDVDREDTVLANLTARQLMILAVTGIVLYGAWSITRIFVPLPVFLIPAVPVAFAAAFLVLGKHDGLALDRLVLAALRQRLGPRYRVSAPEGIHPAPAWLSQQVTVGEEEDAATVAPAVLRLPAQGVTETGVIDLGTDGVAVVAVCSTVNFALRTPAEQDSLVAAFGRYLHSLTAPVQILIRAERLDLSDQIAELHAHAPSLPHPALEAAAREHADYLAQLGRTTDLLRSQVLLVLREPLGKAAPVDGLGGTSPLAALTRRKAAPQPTPDDGTARRAAEARLVRRLGEAVELLGPIGVFVTPLDPGQATAVLAAACDPDSLLAPSSALAGADDVITTVTADEENRFSTNAGSPAEQPATRVRGWTDEEGAAGSGRARFKTGGVA
ncbi:PrgI family protein [Streptomyces sp. GQFP]|uniref:PrgI family protein n=1 Tax=Streptomyces sp. GQFP TaxID=2907545 RepID=UPI001F1A0985|nr:PrgI family protein [Streptomyces sp. GQFP]UIX34335.1 PrgI family protein [Streptomyces sp. GQFP]